MLIKPLVMYNIQYLLNKFFYNILSTFCGWFLNKHPEKLILINLKLGFYVWVYTVSDPTQVDLVIAYRVNGYETLRSSLLSVFVSYFPGEGDPAQNLANRKIVLCTHTTNQQKHCVYVTIIY